MTEYAFPPSFRATDADDNPVAGGKMRFYAAGTTTPKAVYSDTARSVSLGTTVNLNSSGVPVSGANTPVLIYYGTGNYKYRLYAADETLLFEFDDIQGFVEPAPEASSGLPVTPVISKTENYTVLEADRGKLIKLDPTGGPFQVTLPSAAAMGDGFRVGFIHVGTANVATLVADTGQFIRGQAVSSALALVGQGESMWLVSDGADWVQDGYSPPWMKAGLPHIVVKGRTSTPPLSSTPGERWIVSGVLSGVWLTLGFEENQIVEADGDGSWFAYTPSSGWLAYDAETDEQLQYRAGSWIVVPDVVDPGSSILKSMVIQDQKSSGSSGGSYTVNTWTNAVLNTVVSNDIAGASLNSNRPTLPAGTYLVMASKTFWKTEETRMRLQVNGGSVLLQSPQANHGMSGGNERADAGGMSTLLGVITLESSTELELQFRIAGSQGNLGRAMSIGGISEVYCTLTFVSLSSIQGERGIQGPRGSVSFLDGGELTIASGVVTVTGTYHSVDTEGDASTDDLDTIDGGAAGMMLVLRAADSARTVVLKDGTGNLQINGDCTLDNAQDTITLIFDEDLDAWLEITRSNNGT